MRKRITSQAGFTLVEMLVVSVLGALLSIGLFQLITHLSRRGEESSSSTVAHQVMDEIMKSVEINFQRRLTLPCVPQDPRPECAGPASAMEGASLFGLNNPPAFSPNPRSASSFRCPVPDNSFPNCQNLKLIQIASNTPPNDTYRTVEFKTICQAGAVPFPADFSASQYQSDGGGCATPPVVTMTVTGPGARTATYLGDKIIGTAMCIRSCVVAPAAGVAKPPVVDYHLEVAVIYRGAGGRWNVLKRNSTLSSGAAAEGVQVLHQ